MDNYISHSQGFLNSIGDFFDRTFGSLAEAYEILNTAISLPLDLVSLLPTILGAAVSIVVFVMVVKFILGR